MGAYLVADPAAAGKTDAADWNAAHQAVFGTPVNPSKTSRSTVGVAALVNPAWLFEVDAFAAVQ